MEKRDPGKLPENGGGSVDLPALNPGERGLIKSPDILIKKIPFDAFLTSERVILRPVRTSALPGKDISLDTIESAVPGKSENGDPSLILSVALQSGEIKRMVIIFPSLKPGNRRSERDRWVLRISGIPASAGTQKRDTRTKDRPAESPINRITFNDGIHIREEQPKRVPAGVVHLKNGKTGQGTRGNSLKFRENGITNEELIGNLPSSNIVSYQPTEPEKETDTIKSKHASSPTNPVQHADKTDAFPRQKPVGERNLIFCNTCSNQLPVGSRFCNRCGTKITPSDSRRDSVTVPAAPQNPAPLQHSSSSALFLKSDPAHRDREHKEFDIRDLPVETLSKTDYLVPSKSTHPNKKPSHQSDPPNTFAGQKKVPAKTVIAISAVIIIVAVIAGIVFFNEDLLKAGSLPDDISSGSLKGTPASVASAENSNAPFSSASSVNSTGISYGPTTITPSSDSTIVIPSEGVYIYVDYLGSFTGTFGTASETRSVKNSGERIYEVMNATGTIVANFQKLDISTKHSLSVKIYKNGISLSEGTTSNPRGMVNITAIV